MSLVLTTNHIDVHCKDIYIALDDLPMYLRYNVKHIRIEMAKTFLMIQRLEPGNYVLGSISLFHSRLS